MTPTLPYTLATNASTKWATTWQCSSGKSSTTKHRKRGVPWQVIMEQRALKNASNCFNINIYYYLETSDGQSSNLYLNVIHFSTPVLIRHRWQLKTVVLLYWHLLCAVPLSPFCWSSSSLLSRHLKKFYNTGPLTVVLTCCNVGMNILLFKKNFYFLFQQKLIFLIHFKFCRRVESKSSKLVFFRQTSDRTVENLKSDPSRVFSAFKDSKVR